MRDRPVARVLLIGPSGRLLLIRFADPRPDGLHVFWATPGGGVEAGESVPQAAAREVFEETGMTGLDFSPVVWVHDHVLRLGGEDRLFKESYVTARCRGEDVSTRHMTGSEHRAVRDLRWWRLEEIAASAETIYPPGLANLLPPILAGALPPEPLRLG